MSQPVQNNFLENIFNDIGSSGSGSGGSGLSGLFSGLGSLLGPLGTGGGAVLGLGANLIPGLDGFIKNGFDFTCLGKQAFNSDDLSKELNSLNAYATRIKNGEDKDVASFLDVLVRIQHESNIEIGKYKSGCSKTTRAKLRDTAQKIYDSIDKSSFDIGTQTLSNWDGQQYQSSKHTVKSGVSSMDNSQMQIGDITPEKFQSVLVPQITEYALANGLDVQSSIESAYTKLFGSGGGPIFGGIGGGINTNGDWNVGGSLSNKKDDSMMYILGGVALVGVWFLAKRK